MGCATFGGKGIGIVDLWHAKERLWDVGKALHGAGTERCAAWSRWMRYPTFRGMGLCIGAGTVESMCKGLVGERFKRRGMRWSVAGANAVLVLPSRP